MDKNYLTQYIISIILLIVSLIQLWINDCFRKENKPLLHSIFIIVLLSGIIFIGESLNIFMVNNFLDNIELANFIGIVSVFYLLVAINILSIREMQFRRDYVAEIVFLGCLAVIFAFILQIMSKVGNISGEALICIVIVVSVQVILENANIYKINKCAKVLSFDIDAYSKRQSNEYEKVIDKIFGKGKLIKNTNFNSYFDGNRVIIGYFMVINTFISIFSLGFLFPYAYIRYQKYKIKHIKISSSRLKFIGQYKVFNKKFRKWWLSTLLSLFILFPLLINKVTQWKYAHCIIDNNTENMSIKIVKRNVYRRIKIDNGKEITIKYSTKPEYEKKDIIYMIKSLVAVCIALVIILL